MRVTSVRHLRVWMGAILPDVIVSIGGWRNVTDWTMSAHFGPIIGCDQISVMWWGLVHPGKCSMVKMRVSVGGPWLLFCISRKQEASRSVWLASSGAQVMRCLWIVSSVSLMVVAVLLILL